MRNPPKPWVLFHLLVLCAKRKLGVPRFAAAAPSAAIIVPAPREASERVNVSIFVRLGVNPFAPHLPRVFRMPREIAFVER